MVHLADSANIKGFTSIKLSSSLTGLCFESPNDTIHVTVWGNFPFINHIMEEKKMKNFLRLVPPGVGFILLMFCLFTATNQSYAQWIKTNSGTDTQVSKKLLETLWAKTYGDSLYEEARSVKRTYDGGYVVAGMSGDELWILKLNSSGEIDWQKLYKNAEKESYEVHDLAITSDGGCIVIGSAITCYDTTAFCLGYGWLLKLDSAGEISWQKGYRIGAMATFFSGQQTSDNGYILAGFGDALGQVTPITRLWLLKADNTGDVLWQIAVALNDGYLNACANSVQQTNDGGYIVAGYVSNPDTMTSYDIFVLKFDQNGNLQWHKAFVSDEVFDIGWCGRQTNDNGYIIAGQTQDTIGYGMDGLLMKLNNNGAVQWQRNYESGEGDGLRFAEQTNDGGYIAGGLYSSGWEYNGGDIMKTDQEGYIEWQKIYPNDKISSIVQTADTGFVFASNASVEHNGWTSVDYIVVKTDRNGNTTRNLEDANVSVYNTSLSPYTINNLLTTSLQLEIINTKTFAVNTNVTPRDAWPLSSVRSESRKPLSFELLQNYPNPFNPLTTIQFEVGKTSHITLKVFDFLGREVETLLDERKVPGNYKVRFDGSNLPSGVYFYRLSNGSVTQEKKMILLK